MKLVVFDLDGTLTRTNKVADLALTTVVKEQLDVELSEADLSRFRDSTDSSILKELFLEYKKSRPKIEDIQSFKSAYINKLIDLFKEQPAYFKTVVGVRDMLKELPNDEWKIAIATESWLESAHVKTELAGISLSNIPIGTGSDALQPASILKTAIRRAKIAYNVEEFDRVVYVGDAILDLEAAIECNLPFVGIEVEKDAVKRAQLGATFKLYNYRSWKFVLEILEKAKVPVLKGKE